MAKKITKSQAALEFMVTYGWVILGVMIVIGALAYYGVFNTSKYINDECNFGNQLYCEDFRVTTDRIYITLRNNFGQEIVINNFLGNYNSQQLIFHDSFTNIGIPILPGETLSFGLEPDPRVTFPKNDKVNIKMTVSFNRNIANAPLHNVSGLIIATPQ
ncbi:MAG: hypothetical protein KatS3mg002_0741 [Candidatus Woesearchaeota archaeon]|nr:MAG: hypothetical protein KatS3mg002_0741 [Candidatus Woesearchaeota archaeon]